MLKLIRDCFRGLISVSLWIVLIICFIALSRIPNFGMSEIIIGIIIVPFITVILIGYIATILNIDKSLENIDKNLEKIVEQNNSNHAKISDINEKLERVVEENNL